MPGALNLGDRGFVRKSHLFRYSEKGCPVAKNNTQGKLLLNEYLNNYNGRAKQKEGLVNGCLIVGRPGCSGSGA